MYVALPYFTFNKGIFETLKNIKNKIKKTVLKTIHSDRHPVITQEDSHT